jgi:hypothetical protein
MDDVDECGDDDSKGYEHADHAARGYEQRADTDRMPRRALRQSLGLCVGLDRSYSSSYQLSGAMRPPAPDKLPPQRLPSNCLKTAAATLGQAYVE